MLGAERRRRRRREGRWGRVTVEVWSGKGLDNGETEEEISWRDPAFDNDVSGRKILVRYADGYHDGIG
jgi:hypothetical protein